MPQAPVKPGDILAAKYRVERVLGAGGMGVVVLATHTQLDQSVALKFLLPSAMANPQVAGRFQREAKLAVKLKSEHVAKVLDVGTLENGAPYIVMEYLSGEDLCQRIERDGPLSVAEAAECVIQACDAIAEAHALGIVHRDLKPANLFLTHRPDNSPLVKVLDFGISKASQLDEGGHSLTKTSSVMGSPHYMSPEQMISSKDVDTRSDIWSIGAIIHQLISGSVPFNADTLGALMSRVLTEPPPSLAQQVPGVPQQLSDLVTWCLQRDLAKRAPNVAEVAIGLAPFAPPRAHPIAERIATLLGAGGRLTSLPNLTLGGMHFSPAQGSQPAQGSMPHYGGVPLQGSVSSPGVPAQGSVPPEGVVPQQGSVPPQVQAQQPLGTTQSTGLSSSNVSDAKKRSPALAIVAVGVVVLGAAGLGVRHFLTPHTASAPPAPVPAAATETTAPSQAASPPPPTSAEAAPKPQETPSAADSASSAPNADAHAGAASVVAKKHGTGKASTPAPEPHAPAPAPVPAPPGPKKSVLDDRN
jgi:serine/threonine-protein kinase